MSINTAPIFSSNGDGKVTTPVGLANDIGYSVFVQANGKILVAGWSYNGVNADFALVRYNQNGLLDASFDGNGKVTSPVDSTHEEAYCVAVQADGKILVAGESGIGSNYDIALFRYNSNGSLDTSFDGDGKITTAIGSFVDLGHSVTVQADGKILMAGTMQNSSNYDFALVRYNSNGSLDTSFSGDGKVSTDIGTSNDWGYSVIEQTDGKILLAGTSTQLLKYIR